MEKVPQLSNVVDLMERLRQSLEGGGGRAAKGAAKTTGTSRARKTKSAAAKPKRR